MAPTELHYLGTVFFGPFDFGETVLPEKAGTVQSDLYVYLFIFFVMVSWVIFALTDFSAMGNYFVTLFAFRGGNDWIYYLRNYGVVLLLGIFFSTP